MKKTILASLLCTLTLVSISGYAQDAVKPKAANNSANANAVPTANVDDQSTTPIDESSSLTSDDLLAKLNQTFGRTNMIPNFDWTRYVQIHGGFFIDGRWGNTSNNTTGVNNDTISINDAYLDVQAKPNDWAKLNVVINYFDPSNTYAPLRLGKDSDQFYVDQAYITIGNLDRYPFYLQAGKQYIPFGRYDLYPITKSFVQVLTESNQTDVQAGFITERGLYGSAYVFENPVSEGSASGDESTNFGVSLGFARDINAVDIDMGVDYLYDMTAVDAINARIQTTGSDYYRDRVAAISPYFHASSGPFGFEAEYVTALESFNKADVPYKASSSDGAQPWAVDTQIDYKFKLNDTDNQIYVGAQWSGEASGVGLPDTRYLVGYNWYPWPNTLLGAQITRDEEYGSDTLDYDGNTSGGDDYYTFSLRAGVKF
ncbi:MAG: LbtU family siderophore porin [Gammaproteobacteria bacterium]